MDLAYDHIQEEALSPDQTAAAAKKASTSSASSEQEKQAAGNLNAELQEAYKSFSASPWGARLGGFLNTVKKQGETYYEGAKQEAGVVGGEAVKGFTDLKTTLVSRARSMSTGQQDGNTAATAPATATSQVPQIENVDPFAGDGDEITIPIAETPKAGAMRDGDPPHDSDRTSTDTTRPDSSGFISRFRSEATKRLQDIQKAEDAADEALLRFGTNISNFLKDAVTVTAGPDAEGATTTEAREGKSKVLWESKSLDGKRVQHATRFEAQLHAIHSSYDSFTKDPVSPEYESWTRDFNIEKKTEGIGKDLEEYKELRQAMERLVPEKVEYGTFWMRYYFLRMVVDEEEKRRREMLKEASTPDAPIAWDDDSDSDADTSSTPQWPQTAIPTSTPTTDTATMHQSNASSTTIQAPKETSSIEGPDPPPSSSSSLKPNEPLSRRSQDEKSQADSDASYDIVSGATSRGPPSPKEVKDSKGKEAGNDDNDDDEPDWE